jgi:hypothetical protein
MPAYDSLFSFHNLIDTFTWGAQHQIPIQLSLPPVSAEIRVAIRRDGMQRNSTVPGMMLLKKWILLTRRDFL